MNHSPDTFLAFINMPGGTEWIVILVIGLLLFGRRLPEVGRSLGRGIVEFKKGVKGIEDEIEGASSEASRQVTEDRRESLPGTAAREATDPVGGVGGAMGAESNPYRERVESPDPG